MTQQLQLDGDGPFETPRVVGFLGLVIAQGRLPVQIRFVLEGGSELRLPIADYAYDKLIGQMAALAEAQDREQ